jgi:hypothetical protein
VTEHVILVRLLPGRVRESQRTVHTVPVPDDQRRPEQLTARCGLRIEPDQFELLTELTGMPCTPCLLATPPPDTETALPPAAGAHHQHDTK